MPTLKDFGGFVIQMYFNDHNPPHVHVASPDETALVKIADGGLLAGSIKAAVLARARDWIAEHRDELLVKWQEYQG